MIDGAMKKLREWDAVILKWKFDGAVDVGLHAVLVEVPYPCATKTRIGMIQTPLEQRK